MSHTVDAMLSILQHLHEKILRLASRGTNNKTYDESLFPGVGLLSADQKVQLEHVLGVGIRNVSFFEQALTHRSYLQTLNNPQAYSNERLEFLGDAILSMIIAEYLFYLRSDVSEGELTKMRSWLVNKKSLAYSARRLNLHQFLKVSISARQSLEQGNDSMLADALEAIIAAVYLDSGWDAVKQFIVASVLSPVMKEESLMKDTNYKSILLEHSQALGTGIPRYVVVEETGPDHNRQFTIEVSIGSEIVGRGAGRNKKEAEQNAASAAVQRMRILQEQSSHTPPE